MKRLIFAALMGLATIGIVHSATLSQKPKKAKVEKTTPADTAANAEPIFENGGFKEFKRWCVNNVSYPPEAAEQGITGTVYVGFVVDIDGNVVDVKVVTSAHPLLDKALLDIVKRSPKWRPGRKDGLPVRTSYVVDMSFLLKS